MSAGTHIGRILAMDCETSGICWEANKSHSNKTPASGVQAVSWGLVVSDTSDYKPIAQMYREIKWNGKSRWDVKAEKVHGLSKEHLEEHGMDEEEALVDMIEFIMEHIGVKKPLYCLGHNLVSFDIPFFKDMLYRYEIKGIKFGQRHFDTFALSMGTVKQFDSPTLFKRLGLGERQIHNSLEDALFSLKVYRRISIAWEQMLNGK